MTNGTRIASKVILLAEDDPAIQYMYAAKLRLSGFTVITANNGADALEALDTIRPDLALVDLRMPKMDGVELIRSLRNHDSFIEMPIIILTNISKVEAPMELRYFNIHSYVLKAHTTPAQLATLVGGVFI